MKKRLLAAVSAVAVTVALSVMAFADAGLAESGALNEGLMESGALTQGLLEDGPLNGGLTESTPKESASAEPAQTAVVTSAVPNTGVPGAVGALLTTAAVSLGVVVATRKRK